MTRIPTLDGPGALLASIPMLLGFEPRESVVILSIRDSGMLGAMMRVDRQDCLIPEVAQAMGMSIAAHLSRDGAASAVVASFTHEPVGVACDAIDALQPYLGEAVAAVDPWVVHRGRYFVPGCADVSCCPPGGRALPPPPVELQSAPRTRRAAHEGSTDPMLPASSGDRRKASRAHDRWWARRDQDIDQWRRTSAQWWGQTLAGLADGSAIITPPLAGKLSAALRDVRVRDAAILSLIPDGQVAADAVIAGAGEDDVAEALDRVLSPGHGIAPTPLATTHGKSLCAALVGLARAHQRAPMLAIAALIAWWEDDTLSALALCTQAREADPHYTLTELVEATVRCHIEPGWQR